MLILSPSAAPFLKIFDVETGVATTLHTATTRDWRGPVEEDGSWVTQMGLDVMQGMQWDPR